MPGLGRIMHGALGGREGIADHGQANTGYAAAGIPPAGAAASRSAAPLPSVTGIENRL